MLVRIVSIPFAHSVGSGAWWKYSAIGINADQCNVPVEPKDGRSDKDGFRGLWRRLKPADKPDEVNYFLSKFFISTYNFTAGCTI